MSEFKSRWSERKEGKNLLANPFVSFVSSIPSGSEEIKPLESPRKKEKKEIPCPSERARDKARKRGSSDTTAAFAEKSAHPTDTQLTKLTKGSKDFLQTCVRPTDKTDKRSAAPASPEPAGDNGAYHPQETKDPQTKHLHKSFCEVLSAKSHNLPRARGAALTISFAWVLMPPDIQAAYDCGASVIFSKARGRWELYEALEPPKDLSAEARGLLLLYEMGELPERVHKRLTELFTEPPKDIHERLETAALFIEKETA